MEMRSLIPKRWEDKLDHKTMYTLEENILAYQDILDSDLFFFPEYTNHKLLHISNIIEISTALIPSDCDADLTGEDIAVYIISVLYHDIGMHITYEGFCRILTEGFLAHGYEGIYDDRPWPLLWEDYIHEARLWDDRTRAQILGASDRFSLIQVLCPPGELPADGGVLNLYDRLFIGEFLRRNHCRMAFDIACSGFPCAEGSINALPSQWTLIAGHIARSHGVDIWKMLDIMGAQYGGSLLRIRGVHVLYLMAVLRIADYFDISDNRAAANLSRLYHFKSPVSVREWQKNQCVTNIVFGAARDPELLFIETVPPVNSGIYLELKHLMEDMQRELDTSWAVLGDVYGRSPLNLRLSIRRIKSDLTNTGCAEHSVNYLTDKITFRANPGILKLLIGPLYDYQPVYGIRELLQNSIDACREKQALCRERGESYHGLVMVEMAALSGGRGFIRVSDNGIGMSSYVIRNYYMVAGSSYRNDPAWRKDYLNADTHIPKVIRSGRFGIGVLATYLLGEQVHVETTSYLEKMSYSFDAVLESPQLDIYKNPRTDGESGTIITVQTTQKLLDRLKVIPDWYCESEPEVVFIPECRLDRSENAVSHNWKTCVLSTGNTACYRFQKNEKDGFSKIYVNGLLTESNHGRVSVNIRENFEEISLSLKRDRITGINGRSIKAQDIQNEINQSVLLARLLTCDPFALTDKRFTHPYMEDIADKILFAPNGFLPMGLLNTAKSARLLFTVSPDITKSEDALDSFCRQTRLSLENLFFTDSIRFAGNDFGPQIKMAILLQEGNFSLAGVVVGSGYFGAGYPDKSVISNTVGLDFTNYFYADAGEHNEVIYSRKDCAERDFVIGDLKELWLEGCGWPLALYTLKGEGGNGQTIWDNGFISEYLGSTDRIIPYSPEERVRKFPRAFSSLRQYMDELT